MQQRNVKATFGGDEVLNPGVAQVSSWCWFGQVLWPCLASQISPRTARGTAPCLTDLEDHMSSSSGGAPSPVTSISLLLLLVGLPHDSKVAIKDSGLCLHTTLYTSQIF
jgi:hypothetical protein